MMNEEIPQVSKEHVSDSYVTNVVRQALQNTDFRKVLWTGRYAPPHHPAGTVHHTKEDISKREGYMEPH